MSDDATRAVSGADDVVDDRQDLRLAVVMTGGVSLAVWMGGVTEEIDRLARGQGMYAELLELTRSTVRVDVIAGTSAGGLNGAVLAVGRARGASVSSLRDVWLQTAAIDDLMRPATEANPPSLLRGDRFLQGIEDALNALKGEGTDADEVPVHLTVTGTLLRGRHRGFPDDFGSVVRDVEHRAEFRFVRGPGIGDDFADPALVERLALAARCSASFPFAFEPVRCEIGTGNGRDLAGHADFTASGWLVDGGVLANKPLAPALRAVFEQTADRQVRRVLLYVVPEAGENGRTAPEDPQPLPTLAEVALASLMRIPRNQSVGTDLDALDAHNRRVAAQRRRRELAASLQEGSPASVEALARALYERYRLLRAELLADRILRLVAHGAVQRPDSQIVMPERVTLRSALLRELRTLPPDAFPAPGEPVEAWFTTAPSVDRAGAVLIDLLRRALGLLPVELGAERRDVQRLRRKLHAELAKARSGRPDPEDPHLREQLAAEAAAAAADPTALARWAAGAIERVFGEQEEHGARVRAIAALLPDAVRLTAAALAARDDDDPLKLFYEGTEGLVAGLTVPPEDSDAGLRRLLALEVVQVALGEEPASEQAVELMQVSADVPNGFDGRATPERKLAGLQLLHFGAFYKESWRANDWMWGRLDAAERLARLLLDPFRLRQLGLQASEVREAVEAVALGPREDAATREYLEGAGWDAAAVRDELRFLDSAWSEPLPDALEVCTRAVARRLQLEILREEMPIVARTAEREALRDAGRPVAPIEARTNGERPAPQQAVELFRANRLGEQRIADEHGTDRLTRTSSRALAVTASALGGTHAGIGRRTRIARVLRGVGLSVHLVTDAALQRDRAAGAGLVAALVAGFGLLGLGLFVRLPAVLIYLGLILLAGALGTAYLRARFWRGATALVAGALLAVLPRAALWLLIEAGVGWADNVASTLRRYEAAWVVLALALGALIFAAVLRAPARLR